MKIPYNRVHVRGQFLFAARGGSIHSFNLVDGTHVATWKHPDVDKVASAVKANAEALVAGRSRVETEGEKLEEVEQQQQQQQQQQDKAVEEGQEEGHEEDKGREEEQAEQELEEGPPMKRQKLQEATTSTEAAPPVAAQDDPLDSKIDAKADDKTDDSKNTCKPKHFEGRGKRKKGKGKGEEVGWGRLARVPDRPVITHLTSSPDGRRILAITGHDKIIWVLAHDGAGALTELSRRTMPKRPSAVALSCDLDANITSTTTTTSTSSTTTSPVQIICADKFGDVYALPLLPYPSGDAPGAPSSSSSSTVLSALPLPSKKAFKPSANTFTVHSKGNRKALENQILQAELEKQQTAGTQVAESAGAAAGADDGPDFELSLLLGHVSMLTALALAEAHGRRYILTADRDEHIRVSRYMPHAHVIETFCLGHREFVSEMLVPPTRPGLLISGGGDDSLCLWDWAAGKLSSQASVLSLAQQISPEVSKVAVSGLYSLVYPSDEGPLTYLLAICEDIKAIFSWLITDTKSLSHPSIIQIPGNPLHLTVSTPTTNPSNPPVLIAAIDPDKTTPAKSLHAFTLSIDDGRLAIGAESTMQDHALEALEADIADEEVRQLLYTTESLRKISTSWLHEDADADGAQEAAAAAEEAADVQA